MKQITAVQLAGTETLITAFMLDRSANRKTFGQLLDIFESSYEKMKTDPSGDLRILRFSDDMQNGNWHNGIIVACKQGVAVDAIHRGLAYLRCVRKGVSETILPKVFIDEV